MTQGAASKTKEKPTLDKDKHVSYYLDSLLTNISVQETTDYNIL